ncbi:hypothetical protein NCLIV_008080 [Neospora caninum Liverpool]|uniref:Major facilitator superfamily (MFS) profile domain-containing protein n=1 Tax=Neospora caninum (strain Liverpool) TaxID=572307 RepID=F0V9B1_NEOCL|nr:hypothetical protein NCLIV_008080 [Neospora caninum Liverpool]CBZ50336.1 hypothetical protein NCLIV_008080 [Neospora caninum Liverpool]|eukprot:XP_003880370.1 hypothetical protein NCLIV_008080 [Neospora caninum Liverpool]
MVAADIHPEYPPHQEITLVHASLPHASNSSSVSTPVSSYKMHPRGEPRQMKLGDLPKNAKRGAMGGSRSALESAWAETGGPLSQTGKPLGQPSGDDFDGSSVAPTAAEVSNVSSRWTSGGDGQPREHCAGSCRSAGAEERDQRSEGKKRRSGLGLLQRLRQRRVLGGGNVPPGADERQITGPKGADERGGIASRVLGRPSDVMAEGEGERGESAAVDGGLDETKMRDAEGEFPPEALEAMQRQRSNEKMIVAVFCLMFALEIFVNFDSGVVPAILLTLQEQFHLDGAAAGLLGSLPYIGLVASSPFVGRGLTTFSPKWFCLITMMVNLVATGLLGLASNKLMLYLSRLLIGLSQSGFSIYAPVWVDQFAPADKLTLWMGLAQGGVVIGTMLGCMIAGSFDTAARAGVETISWRYAMLIQAIALFILLTIWLFFPRRFVDITMTKDAGDTGVSVVDAAMADALPGATVLEEGEDEADEAERKRGSAETFASASNDTSSEQRRFGELPPPRSRDGESSDVSPAIVVRSEGSDARRGSPETGPEEGLADRQVTSPFRGRRDTGDASPRGRRLSVGLLQRPPSGGMRRTGGDEETGRNAGAGQGLGLPQFRKELLSNLLPLDFIATSPTFTRRASQINPGPAPGSVNAARLSLSLMMGTADGVPRPVGDVPVVLLDASEIPQTSTSAEGLGRPSEGGRELTTLSRLGPPPSSSAEAALAVASALEEGQDFSPGEGEAHSLDRSSCSPEVRVAHPFQTRGGHRTSASVPDIGAGRGRSPSTVCIGRGGSASLAHIHARHSVAGGVSARAGSISGPGDVPPATLNRANSTVSEVQYQMTFLTPHSTTLAFEAFNWAAGTADPLLLVRTDVRPPGDLPAVEGRAGPGAAALGSQGPSHRRRSNASSVVSEHAHAVRLPVGVASPRRSRVSEDSPADARAAQTASQQIDRQPRAEEQTEAGAGDRVTELHAFADGGKRRGKRESDDRTAADKAEGQGHSGAADEFFDWLPGPRISTSSSTVAPRLITLPPDSAEWEPEPHVEALSATPRTFGVWQSICILFESPIYVCVTIALCALFFEVTAIQFWSITYFQQELHVPGAQVLVAFNATAATAPIVGVLAGGWFIDYLGGYKSEKGMLRTLLILGSWAVLCLFFGICASWVPNFIAIICFIWGILFFGGGILPAATGIVIASVPLEVRAFGSGFCMMIYNVFGYVLGTLVPGAIIQAAGLTWGMRVVFLWSIFGVSGLFAAAFVCWRLRIKPAYVSYREKSSLKNEIEIRDVHED